MAILFTLTCPTCGAPLSIQPYQDHYVCDYCSTRHIVKHDSGFYKPKVESETSQRIITEREHLQNEINRLEKKRRDTIHTLVEIYYQPVSLIYSLALHQYMNKDNAAHLLARLNDRQIEIVKAYTKNADIIKLLDGLKSNEIFKQHQKLNRLLQSG